MVLTGCIPQTRHEPPQIVGERTNLQGRVVQRIIRETTRIEHTVPLTPEGPKIRTELRCKFFYQDGDAPRRSFLIGNSATNLFLENCLPVQNSALWVSFWCWPTWTNVTDAAGVVVGKGKRDDLHILVFDVAGFMRHRVFTTTSKLGWDEDYEDSAKARDGNRTIVFKSPGGPKQYDVLLDTVTAAKEFDDSQKLAH